MHTHPSGPCRPLTADEFARLREHALITEHGLLALALDRLAQLEATRPCEEAAS